jgi:predicted Zn-dependent peptidase
MLRLAPSCIWDNGYLMTQAGTAIDKASEAVALTLQEYLKVKKTTAAIKSRELKKAKGYLKGKLILDLEDSQEVAGMYAEDYLLEGKVRSPEEIISQIEAVSLEDVLAVAEQIFRPEKLNLAVIGPYKNEDRRQFENILK